MDKARIQEIIGEASNPTATNGKGTDPAPEATTLPRERVLSIVSGVALSALDELRQLRDQCDVLMRSLIERQGTLIHDIEEFAALSQSTLDTKLIISDALNRLAEQYRASPVAETVEQLPKATMLTGTPQQQVPQ